jgi:hypothetical protein
MKSMNPPAVRLAGLVAGHAKTVECLASAEPLIRSRLALS